MPEHVLETHEYEGVGPCDWCEKRRSAEEAGWRRVTLSVGHSNGGESWYEAVLCSLACRKAWREAPYRIRARASTVADITVW